MLKIHNNPPRREWPALTARCTRQEGEITERVAAILSQVRTGGDKALRDLVARIEGYVPERFEVSRRQRTEAAKAVPQRLKTALAIAKSNIEAFHRAQLPPQVDIEVMPGVRCVQRAVAIGRVGLYVPGGNAPLFSTVLMLALPARIAGCGEVILCTPAGRGGKIAPEVLYRRRPVRRRPHLRRRRGAGRGRHGLRHGKHPARGKDLRPGKPVRHPRQAAGKHRGRGRRPAGRPFGGDGAGRQQRPGGIRRRRSAVAGRARGRQPGHPGLPRRSVSHGR